MSSDTALHDVLIVGSGPAGAAAALRLRGLKVLMVDVGHEPMRRHTLDRNFYRIMEHPEPHFNDLMGPRFESLRGVQGEFVTPRLKAPLNEYITKDSDRFFKIVSDSFRATITYSKGGLANAWGGHMYRYSAADLKRFPFPPHTLEPYYDTLTELIGICGREDDLSRFYGSSKGLLPEHKMTPLTVYLLRGYEARRAHFQRQGLHMGYPRLALLTQPRDGREECRYDNLEFFRPRLPHVYAPAYTLEKLVADGELRYEPGFYVERFREQDGYVEIQGISLADQRPRSHRARRLILGAGTIGTARLVLASYEAHGQRLPILDTPLSLVPLVCPWFIGSPLSVNSYHIQANLMCAPNGEADAVMGTFDGLTGILSSDVIFNMPLAMSEVLRVSKYLLPAMLVLQLWHPAEPTPENRLWLSPEGDIHVQARTTLDDGTERRVIAALRRLWLISHSRLCMVTGPGSSFHYAGTLPMRHEPANRFESYPDGRLAGTGAVYIADAASFPFLSAKSLSLTIMANAMRIADGVRQSLHAP